MKSLILGVLLIALVGIAGFAYRSVKENVNQPVACPLDARVCPDGTSLGRTGTTCTFPACPPPNVTLDALGVSFALPTGYTVVSTPEDASVVAEYATATNASSSEPSSIVIRHYPVDPSRTPLEVIQQTAVGGASGAPVPATAYSSTNIGTHHFTVVSLERFEGVVDTAYYLVRENDVLRFDSIDRGVTNWTDSGLDVSSLPAARALREMLGTLQGA